MKVQLSAVIITFNEEHNIGRCLESIKDVVDEIVVVDSFSTDRTREICESYGAKFIEHIFEGHIQQKNWAITQASNPYVLSLDADEALDETLKQEVLKTKNNWVADAYRMNRLTNYCGQWIHHSGWYPDRKLRLWDSRLGEWGGDNPHDRYELHDSKGTIQQLKGDILHYSYYTVEEHYKQSIYFTDIQSKAQYNRGKRVSTIQLVVNPAVRFIKNYFINLGFLDGKNGWIICKISAYSTYLKYKKILQLQRANK